MFLVGRGCLSKIGNLGFGKQSRSRVWPTLNSKQHIRSVNIHTESKSTDRDKDQLRKRKIREGYRPSNLNNRNISMVHEDII